MIDQKLHMFQLDIKHQEGNAEDTRCIVVEFVPPTDARGNELFHPSKLSVAPRVSPGDLVVKEEEGRVTFRECVGDCIASADRTHEADKIQLQPEMVQFTEGVSHAISLEIQMAKMLKGEQVDSGEKMHSSSFIR